MTDRQLNTLNMANAVSDVVANNIAIWTANAKTTAAVGAVNTTITAINGVAGIQGQSAKGTTLSKHQLWQIAAGKAEHLVFALKAYATDVNDQTLLGVINFSASDFERGNAQECVNRMQIVYNKASGLAIALLTPFNIVVGDVSGLQTAITNLTNAMPGHTIMKAATKAATGQLGTLFTTLRSELKTLDNLVGTYKVSQPNFVAVYTNARKIIDLGKTMQAEEHTLMPHHFESAFGKKFNVGDTFTVRNHSTVGIKLFLTDTPNVLPTTNGVGVDVGMDVQLRVPEDFGGVFGHWLIIWNPNDLDDAHVTVILAHGKSGSSAAPLGNQSA